jgi:cytochrome b561
MAHASHALLYILFFAAPLTGWLFSSAAGFQTVYFGVVPLPDLLAEDRPAATSRPVI